MGALSHQWQASTTWLRRTPLVHIATVATPRPRPPPFTFSSSSYLYFYRISYTKFLSAFYSLHVWYSVCVAGCNYRPEHPFLFWLRRSFSKSSVFVVRTKVQTAATFHFLAIPSFSCDYLLRISGTDSVRYPKRARNADSKNRARPPALRFICRCCVATCHHSITSTRIPCSQS